MGNGTVVRYGVFDQRNRAAHRRAQSSRCGGDSGASNWNGRTGAAKPKVLIQRLRQLERDGLVVRTYDPEVPPRVEYEIGVPGLSLAPLFAHLTEWGAAHLGRVEEARRAYDADPARG